MKKRLMLMLVLMALLTIGAPVGAVHKARALDGDGLPCDPTPSQFRICQIRGGTFNFVTCRCEFP